MWPVTCAFTTYEVADTLQLPRAKLLADRRAGRLRCSFCPDYRETPLNGVHNLLDIVRYDLRHSVDVHGPERRLQDSTLTALFWMHYCRDRPYVKAMLEEREGTLLILASAFVAQSEQDFEQVARDLRDPSHHIARACSSWLKMFWLFARRETLISEEDYLNV